MKRYFEESEVDEDGEFAYSDGFENVISQIELSEGSESDFSEEFELAIKHNNGSDEVAEKSTRKSVLKAKV